MFEQSRIGIGLAFIIGFCSNPTLANTLSEIGLNPQSTISNFTVERIYKDSEGQPMGARLIHKDSCTPLTFIQKQIVPQFYIAVDTPPTTDQGLPHSLEHLLAGKGTKGRLWGLIRQMRLARTSAATSWNYTYYSFNAPLGKESFYEELTALFDALFRPDFTDEEAVNEFYHFGVEKNSSTGELSLTEKGSVYSEMQSQIGYWDFWRVLNKLTLGENHPWGFNSGGDPQAMRGVTPGTIRAFHRKHYKLGPTTSLYLGLSAKFDVEKTLAQVDKIIRNFGETQKSQSCPENFRDFKLGLYPIDPMKKPTIKIIPFPSKSLTDPVEFWLAWNPVLTHSIKQIHLLDLFLEILTKDAESPLYLSFISLEKRQIETGATKISSQVSTAQSPQRPIPIIQLNGIPGDRISEQFADKIRSVVVNKITAIAQLKAGSAELADLKRKAMASIKSRKRAEFIWMKSPPKLGRYETFTPWKERFDLLDLDENQTVTVDSTPIWDQIEELIQKDPNPWSALVKEFSLLSEPHVAVSLPSPQLLKKNDDDRKNRTEAEIERLKALFHVRNNQEAMKAELEDEKGYKIRASEISTRVPRLKFTKNPPLVPDPEAKYERGKLLNKVNYHVSLFDETPQQEVALRFDLRSLPQRLYPYLSALTILTHKVGLQEGSKITNSAALQNQMQEDNADISESLDADWRRRNYSWVLRATGMTLKDLETSLAYVDRILRFPFLSEKNISRIRELLNERISQDDHLTQCCDTGWIEDPAYAFRAQDDLLYLAIGSPFSRSHWLTRVLWRLHDKITEEETKNLEAVAKTIEGAPGNLSAAEWNSRILTFSDSGVVGELRKYLQKSIKLIPPSHIQDGLERLISETVEDLQVGSKETLEDLIKTKTWIFNRNLLNVESETTPPDWKQLHPWLTNYVTRVPSHPVGRLIKTGREPNRIDLATSDELPIVQSIRKRDPSFGSQFPFYVAFVNEDGTTGNAVITAEGPNLTELARAQEFLATKIYGGTGTQSFWMKTWEAGLAHANGAHSSASDGEIGYYADRSVNITALLKLVKGEAGKSKDLNDGSLGDYALAGSFNTDRMDDDPINRGDALAQDFRTGATPERRKRFSRALISEAKKPDLAKVLISKTSESIASVLLTNDHKEKKKKTRALFFFLGPESQFRDLDPEIPSGQKLTRIWASDYWLNWPR